MNKRPWTIRPWQPGDEGQLVALFERVYGRCITTDHYHWKLRTLPSPVENIWLAVEGDGRIVCQYAGIPIRYRLMGQERTVMVTVDVMTAPEARRQGVLTAVADQTFAAWREAGVPFTIGTPNEKMGSRTRAIGFDPHFPLRWYVRPLRPGAVARRRLLGRREGPIGPPSIVDKLWNRWWNRKVAPDDSLDIEQVETADERFDALWHRCANDKPLSIVRDSRWVTWRFLERPEVAYRVFLASRNGRPAGYVVSGVTVDEATVKGVLVEWLAPTGDGAAQQALVRHALDDLTWLGAQSAASQALPGSAEHALLKGAGFVGRETFTVWVADFSGEGATAVVGDPAQWRMFGGDYDVV